MMYPLSCEPVLHGKLKGEAPRFENLVFAVLHATTEPTVGPAVPRDRCTFVVVLLPETNPAVRMTSPKRNSAGMGQSGSFPVGVLDLPWFMSLQLISRDVNRPWALEAVAPLDLDPRCCGIAPDQKDSHFSGAVGPNAHAHCAPMARHWRVRSCAPYSPVSTQIVHACADALPPACSSRNVLRDLHSHGSPPVDPKRGGSVSGISDDTKVAGGARQCAGHVHKVHVGCLSNHLPLKLEAKQQAAEMGRCAACRIAQHCASGFSPNAPHPSQSAPAPLAAHVSPQPRRHLREHRL